MILQLAGSLIAILALAGLARWFGFGGGAIESEAAACAEAEAAFAGFTAARATLSADARAALVEGVDGSLVVLKLHGVHPAGRRVARDQVRADRHGLRIETGDARFGNVLVRR